MKKAFTIIELIFVIVILAILSAIAVPKLKQLDKPIKSDITFESEKQKAIQKHSGQPVKTSTQENW